MGNKTRFKKNLNYNKLLLLMNAHMTDGLLVFLIFSSFISVLEV
jgi:hypothetical protein